MHALSGLALAAFVFLCISSSRADAVSTTNFSDQWWNGNESGWGASALQQGDVIFFDLFVYGTDNKATWYTAAANYQAATAQGHVIFGGDLYVTNGPYFGGPFNPASVNNRKVGTLTFDADSVDTARLSYPVDGVAVAKSVTRQLWRFENFTGNYYGGIIYNLTQCANPANNGHVEELGTLNINHSATNVITMVEQTSGGSCNYVATYSQAGHMGTMRGSFSCTNGVTGSFTAVEMEKNISGMTGRFVAQSNVCSSAGHFGGLVR